MFFYMKSKIFESMSLCCLLASVGGFLDIYTYILKGHVFANAQTGNIVLMAYSVASGDYTSVFMYALPIIAFASGVFVSEFIRHHFSYQEMMTFHHVILIVEIVVLTTLMKVEISRSLFNAIVGFICSMQVSTFTHVVGLPFASTMCTGNLKSMSLQFYQGIFNRKKQNIINGLIYLGIIVSFIIGAIIATGLISAIGPNALLYPILVLTVVAAIQIYQYYLPE